ncbi:MAG: mannitol-1-phosphate 5-dehydrogenase [Bacteroidia bacterium]|nr:mannitol-1-phosphate 5-dehydrogenase [Bacteroidia bacterium]
MKAIKQDKIVIFGAGKIGRSFIGQLFSLGGYEVVFVDVNKRIIDELNNRRNYNVIIRSEIETVINIKNVRGVYADDESVAHEVATAGIVAVSVGLHGLSEIFPGLAKGLAERYEIDNYSPLDIIIAENMRDADAFFREELRKLTPATYPLERLAGLVETSIGKMVPIMLNKDMEADVLQVFAEPYNTLILDKKAFKNPIPQIAGLSPKENMKAWVDRKLFIHNLGHAAAAYIGYLFNQDFVYLHEALATPKVHDSVRNTMLQSADILMKKYPGEFSKQGLTEHIDDLLSRFQNKALGDTIFRVGCDLFRKLGPEDRMAGAIKAAIDFNLPYDKILFALVCGLHFRAADENGNMLPQDIEFAGLVEKGVSKVLSTICGFDPTQNSRLFEEARATELYLGASATQSA